MKKLLPVFLSVILISSIILIFSTCVFAEQNLKSNKEKISGNFKYTLSGSNATITGYLARKDKIDIPEKLDGHKVIGIAGYSFSNLNYADVDHITIPRFVTKIETYFSEVDVNNIFVDANNKVFSSVDGILYNKNQTKLIYFPRSRRGNIEVRKGVKVIGPYAFYFCEMITTISIPKGVTYIGENCFYDCFNLKRIIIPASVTLIGKDAFEGCYDLTNISFLGNAPKMSKNIFSSIIEDRSSDFSVSYIKGKTGFNNIWTGVKVKSFSNISTFILPDWVPEFLVGLIFIIILTLFALSLFRKDMKRNK